MMKIVYCKKNTKFGSGDNDHSVLVKVKGIELHGNTSTKITTTVADPVAG